MTARTSQVTLSFHPCSTHVLVLPCRCHGNMTGLLCHAELPRVYGDVARFLPGLFLTDMGQPGVPRIRLQLYGSNLNVNNTRAGVGIGELMHWGRGVSEIALYDSTSPASYSNPMELVSLFGAMYTYIAVQDSSSSRCMLTVC